jgi:hypothetical protein
MVFAKGGNNDIFATSAIVCLRNKLANAGERGAWETMVARLSPRSRARVAMLLPLRRPSAVESRF